MGRFSLPPRLVDWSLFFLVCFEVASGLVSLTLGRPEHRFLFYAHGVAGFALVVLLFWKLRRVFYRITDRSQWDRITPVSILAALVAIGALASGIMWAFGFQRQVVYWEFLMLHMALGLLLLPLVLVHLAGRFRPPERSDFEGRRTALTYLALGAVGALAWRAQSAINRLLETEGADRRFTGSRERGSFAGNEFPVVSWVADDPDPVSINGWSLSVGGTTENELEIGYEDLTAKDRTRSLLDCTSGWYSVQDWTGVRVGDLLDSVEPTENAQYVRFRSVTGYRWNLPIEEAREVLLATHVDEEAISQGHGFPLRVVTPGRRGFQWVKWVESVEVREEYDYGQWVVIFTSGFT